MFERVLAASGAISLALVLSHSPAEAQWWNPFSPHSNAADGGMQRDPRGRLEPLPQPGGGMPAAAPFQGQGPASPGLAVQLGPIEEQLRNLTGQVEEMGHVIRQLQERLRQLEASTGVAPPRQRSDAAPPAAAPAGGLDGSALADRIRDEGGEAAMAGQSVPAARIPPGATAGPGAPPRILGTVPATGPGPQSAAEPAGSGAPISLTSLGRSPSADGGQREVPTVSGAITDPRQDYDSGYRHIVAGDYAMAENTFRAFLARYPNDARAADAHYWLGESLFMRRQYQESADAFLAGYRADPNGEKAPDTLLKLGLSLDRLGARKEACSAYAEVLRSYPEINNALRQRVLAEQASAEC